LRHLRRNQPTQIAYIAYIAGHIDIAAARRLAASLE
jgi:hypothetical protein